MKRRAFRFRGRVQHVGFRYIASSACRENQLTGWVRNEYDGTVSMEVQGEEAAIERVLMRLLNDRFIRSDDYDIGCMAVKPEEQSFEVRR